MITGRIVGAELLEAFFDPFQRFERPGQADYWQGRHRDLPQRVRRQPGAKRFLRVNVNAFARC